MFYYVLIVVLVLLLWLKEGFTSAREKEEALRAFVGPDTTYREFADTFGDRADVVDYWKVKHGHI